MQKIRGRKRARSGRTVPIAALSLMMAAGLITARAESWTPAKLDGLALWLDASDADTVKTNGLAVSQLGDKSGSGRHATQGTAASQPLWVRGQNLLLRSEEFDQAAWPRSQTTVTANLTQAPDGALTGDKLIDNTVSGQHYVTQTSSIAPGQQTAAVYAKAGELGFVRFGCMTPSYGLGVFARFNLKSGVVDGQTVLGGATSCSTSMEPVGDGWYRLTASANLGASATGKMHIGLLNVAGNADYVGDGTSGVYFWGAQLNGGDTSDPYQRTEGAAVTQRNLNGLPVLGFDGTDDALSTWVREQNLLLRSEEFDHASWQKGSATVTGNAAQAPDGATTADMVIGSAVLNQHYVVQNMPITPGQQTATVYAKAGELGFVRFGCMNPSYGLGVYARFNLTNGVVDGQVVLGGAASCSTSMEPVGGGWYRLTASANLGTNTTGKLHIGVLNDTGQETYVGNGTSGIYFWGAQLNDGAYSLPYRRTEGGAFNIALGDHTLALVVRPAGNGGLLNYSGNTNDQSLAYSTETLDSTQGGGGVSVPAAAGSPLILVRSWDGTASQAGMNLSLNGTLATAKNGTPSDVKETAAMTVGRALSFSTNVTAEVIVVPAAVSTLDRQRLEGYLAHKWGLQASLPSAHPFRNAPPPLLYGTLIKLF